MLEMFALMDVIPIEVMVCSTMAVALGIMERKLETMDVVTATTFVGVHVVVDAMWVPIDVLTSQEQVKVLSTPSSRSRST